MEPVIFLGHQNCCGAVMAVFGERLNGGKFYLTLTECEQRLANLKNRDVSHDETRKAVENWPEEPEASNLKSRSVY